MNTLSLFDTLFGNDGFALTGCNTMPQVDVMETKDSYVLEMDLPGKTESDIDLSLKEGILTISSVRKADEKTDDKEAESEEEQKKWLIKERRNSDFRRTFQLPNDIDPEQVNATFKNGVLSISMKKRPEPSVKKIAITAA
ncbi:Hsp20/alpha crystallin family protein [Treponema sp.]|uniref:Hsp20/alpha crystallin family protein n=1 Tax=Treponema sp. TaxID=166 RepID=UPI00260102B7|nr:Hsp20/alpha crystallin family protein [Treponema sp.]MCR5218491.1 Hsp20/alpha crystallin family protein [Treponema sp.]